MELSWARLRGGVMSATSLAFSLAILACPNFKPSWLPAIPIMKATQCLVPAEQARGPAVNHTPTWGVGRVAAAAGGLPQPFQDVQRQAETRMSTYRHARRQHPPLGLTIRLRVTACVSCDLLHTERNDFFGLVIIMFAICFKFYKEILFQGFYFRMPPFVCLT